VWRKPIPPKQNGGPSKRSARRDFLHRRRSGEGYLTREGDSRGEGTSSSISREKSEVSEGVGRQVAGDFRGRGGKYEGRGNDEELRRGETPAPKINTKKGGRKIYICVGGDLLLESSPSEVTARPG